MQLKINLDGCFYTASNSIFTISNRAFKYGDALFETIKIQENNIAFLEDHYFRLLASMRMLRMEIPNQFSLDFFKDEILNTLSRNGFKNARARITIFRKSGGLYRPLTNEISYCIEVVPLEVVLKTEYKIGLYDTHAIEPTILSSLKTTHKMVQILAAIYADENELSNCILLNTKKQVIEFTNGNLFIVNQNEIITPPITDGCIKGIMRKQILGLIQNDTTFKTYAVKEASITLTEINKAEEIFMTNVIVGVQPVSQFKSRDYKTKIGDLINKKITDLSYFE